jgi:hypothetical protein
VFDGVPDIRAELLRSAEAGDACWAEWYWQGNRIDGTRLEMRGVTIFGIQHDRIMWAGSIWKMSTAQAETLIRLSAA